MVWTSMLAHAFNASKEQITTLGITMGYRKCVITNENSTEAPILVVYLHGGSSKGNDNEKQLLEPGTDSIARYLETHGINAIFLIPQCPTDKSWGGPMNTMLKAMIDRYASEGVADTNRIYIFGESMEALALGACSPPTPTSSPPPCLWLPTRRKQWWRTLPPHRPTPSWERQTPS